jgi:ATP-dependent Clp protease ATP-binding subunit ClpA
MRAGACTVQQALTPDATAVVKQAVSLARRRGNPQVTPLHVASAMLQQPQHGSGSSSSTGLLRAACLRSHSHPLQCKALELCFNVALNRLPAASTSPLLGHGNVYYPPSLSNALVAAFKRAQAHQRRGSVDAQQQQQPVLAVKIELEQLVISILDDPSVSRVMREAGFSSTQVKANVEHAVSSVEGNSPARTSSAAPQSPNPSAAPAEETKPSKPVLPLDPVRDEDVRVILDAMANRSKRRFMVVAECATTAEAAARAAVEKIKRGEALRGVQVVSLRVSRFRELPRDDAERLLAELRRAVKAAGGRSGGVLIFVEDLAWAAEFLAGRGRWPSSCCYYNAVEHAVVEVRALACHDGDGVWLVGHGTYQSYMRCRDGRPSLEMLWELQTLAVPAGSLALSLNCVDNR